MRFLSLIFVIGSCTEPVPVEPGVDSEQENTDIGEGGERVVCETHQECESNVCGVDDFCAEEANIVYVSQAIGAPGGCGTKSLPCENISLAREVITENRKIIFVSERLYNERLSFDGQDVQIFGDGLVRLCLLYTSPSPRDATLSRMPSSA